MAGIRIEIKTDNAAFAGPDFGPEVARILRELAEKIEYHPLASNRQTLRDINGNTVGEYVYKVKE